ncbi:hypothetical protein TVAG_385180 [Trichomonas vaginalis G3]|uniref:Uncharacterized protein n=1 Tax=Trichomonas vaginalis (strain ATCC PRA-98 / G3) TaxID=412133 RepID=A2FIY1_TRIV3|nr:serine transport [Trichomonas vaginalis G3]EAX95130.1 hypothetical protein TVAG_385180 [Trichomonas vaginalis G3]KAI5496071.1 serine transport [Trichomonas vaginalis G3]|eukprot:XP_001308060.1 hypothetical protein [Trichomonas vaginalis G3]
MYYTNSNGLYSEFDNNEKRSKLLTIANLYYATVFLVFAILMYVFKYNGYAWIGKIIYSQYKDNNSAIGDQLVGRTGLALALWFLILGMCTLLNPNMRDSYQFKIHTRYYIIKTLILFGIFAGFLFLPDEIISFYLRMSMYTTFLYLIFQMFFLMDFFHNLNEKYTQKENQIIPFAPKSCKVNQALLSTNFVIAILFLIISAVSEHHSAFTAALVGGYIMYLTVMGFYREDTQCNRLQKSTNSLVFTIISSLMMIFYNVYSAFTATFKFHLFDDEEFKCCDHEICQ